MNRLLNLFLVPPVVSELQDRYRRYRASRASRLASGTMVFCIAVCWLFLRFESPSWQNVQARRTRWYPQFSPSKPRLADPLRYLVQSLWLLVIIPSDGLRERIVYTRWPQRIREKVILWLESLPKQVKQNPLEIRVTRRIGKMNRLGKRVLIILTSLIAITLAMFCISQPFGYIAQFVFVVLLWSIAMIIRRIPGRFPALMLIVLSLTISCRYLWWRYTSTLNWDDPLSLICGLLLLGAETYSWTVLVLGYIQTIWPLNRKPVPMPADVSTWPTVDLMIPTYNEDLSVVKPTLYAALGLDWPRDKLTIYLLDDGNRKEFADFAHEIGVQYIARETHEHAKAGNINHALKYAKSQLVAIFDCDHVPTRSFLQLTVGWFFKDKNSACCRRRITSSRRILSNATLAACAARQMKASCSTGWCRTVTTCGMPVSSVVHARCYAVTCSMKSAASRWKPSLKMRIPRCGCTATATARHISAFRRPPVWRQKACQRTSASVSAGRAGWCRFSAWITRCLAKG